MFSISRRLFPVSTISISLQAAMTAIRLPIARSAIPSITHVKKDSIPLSTSLPYKQQIQTTYSVKTNTDQKVVNASVSAHTENARRIPVSDLQNLSKEKVPSETFFLELRNDPINAYRKFELNPFEAPESGPLLLKIIADLNQRLQPGSVLELEQFKTFKEQLFQLRKEGIELWERSIPLSDLNVLILKYVESMDKLFRSCDPTLKGTYHRDLAQGYMKSLLNTRDGTRMFFTTHAVDDLYFLDIRPAAIYLNWVIDLPPFSVNAKNYTGGPIVPAKEIQKFLDGLFVDTEEITKHDLGHTFSMKRQDKWLFETSSFSRLELVKEWTRNKNRIMSQWKSLSQTDPALAKAVQFIIFLVIHDKGYQFHLPILRQQFHSAKWVEMARFNQKHGYYGKNGITDEVDSRLEQGRIWLVNLVEQMLKEDNLQKITSLNAETQSVVIKRWQKIETYNGIPINIEANGVQDLKITFNVPGVGMKSTSLYLISLVLTPTADKPILTPEKIDRLEKWIWQKKHSNLIDSLTVNPDGEVTARLKGDAKFQQAPEILAAEEKLSKVELYKLERLLYLTANKMTVPFTITLLPKSFKGTITKIDYSNECVDFIDDAGQMHSCPLIEVSFQPDHQFLNTHHPAKYINLNPDDRFVDANVLRKSYIHYEQSMNVSAPPFVNIDNHYELAIVDTHDPRIARAVSSILTRSLNDAKYTHGGYLPPAIVERVQLELISPYGITHVWGATGHRFVLSREATGGKREMISTALVHRSRDGIFFFTSKFNNLRHSTLRYDLDFDYSADGNPEHKWFNKFCYPEISIYKPKGFHHFANFVVEREGVRRQGIAHMMIQQIIKNYSLEYICSTGSKVQHSQRLICGSGLWQIGDPPWLARMTKLGFYQRLGSETFHIDTEWDPLVPTLDKEGKKIDHVAYNQSFGLPEIYHKMLEKRDPESQKIYQKALKDPKGHHLFFRIPEVIEKAQSGRAKLQYFQLILPFTR